ncbi:hypothetical protein FQN49_001178 [Arthroderma sp. PD_2]|nr:hypothetical protein FQN49_001178 [Arthroderma sp. PD_2]
MTIIVRSEKLDNLVPSPKKMKKLQARDSGVSMNWTKDISTKLETKVQSKIHIGNKEKSSTMALKTGRSATNMRPRVPPLPPYSPLGGLQELFKEVGGTLESEKHREFEEDGEAEIVSPVADTSRSCVGTMGDSIDDRLCDDDTFCLSPVTVTTIETGFGNFVHDSHGAAHESISDAAARASSISPLFHRNSKRKQTIYLTLDNNNHPSPDVRPPTSATCCSATTCTSIYPWSSVSCIGEETPRNLSPKVAVNGPFPLLGTADAACFDDESRPTNPDSTTLKRRLTIRESKMKALPPYPPLPADDSFPPEETEKPLTKCSKKATHSNHSPKALSLPQIPQESDFEMLDDTFQGHRRNMSLYPSLEEAAEDLEAHLLTIPSAKETQPNSRSRSPSPFYLQGAITDSESQQEASPEVQSSKSPRMDLTCSGLDRLRESIASKQKTQLSHTKAPKSVQSGFKDKWTRLSTFSKRGGIGKAKSQPQLPSLKLPLVQTADSPSPSKKLDFGFPTGFAELDGETSLREDSSPTKVTKNPFQRSKSLNDSIILRIFRSVGYFDDLFSLATTNRAFYRVFKQNELALVQNTLSLMSLPAWELREMSPPWNDDGVARLGVGVKDEPIPEYTPRLYLRHYSRDLYAMAALKSMILVHCESFLRVETSRALAGLDEQRSAEMDDAFWRVWTFCALFGCGKGREGDIEAQVDWLRGGVLAESDTKPSASISSPMPFISNLLLDPPQGFAKGNDGGLSSEQLCDMSEVWTCLVALLDPFHGKCKEAREYGVFDNKDVTPGDVAQEESLLEEWTRYLLTLGPSAVLTLISFGPSTPVEQKFARARSLGWTRWQAPTKSENEPRRLFFKEAVSRVCRNLPSRPTSLSSSNQSQLSSKASPKSSRSKRSSQSSIGSQNSARRQRQAGFAAELRQRKVSLDTGLGIANAIPHCDERPTPASEAVVHRFICSESGTPYLFPTPPTPASSITSPRKPTPSISSASSYSSYSSRRTPPPPVHPVEEKISRGRQPLSTNHYALYRSNTQDLVVPDPADVALRKMVYELGFDEEEAKWALKRTDTGESVDINAAVHLLLVQSNKANLSSVEMGLRQRESNIPQTRSDETYRPTWRWA